jgi:hypothetical protein
VRIPLDYYRILGLPIQATAEQLRQAHRDRTLQLPRREYSEAAIEARRELIDEAYAVLSDAEQRQDYDASFLAKSYDLDADRRLEVSANEVNGGSVATATDPAIDPYTPSIDIQDPQFVGALLILLELGEYELVLKLGRPYLSSGSISLKNGRFGEPDIVLADVVLTVAFACLELGREQWQQGQYENAAESLETGQELLLREGIFPNVRGEMQADIYKLRPYRVLELLALPESNVVDRRQGLNLLKDMLQDRGGIDGTGDDQSGLNIDDFLRFVQQLRTYLTAAEQQALFEAEARRPSAVATYLAVYALLARGFADRQPALIRRAKLMLIRLGTRQDVHLEQAVCALLLGQTEEASRALELSQEYESLAFIREHSQESPDLLPGLCLYSERWLQNEVFPHFRDLAHRQASLKDYFADEQVQAYLEELPSEPEAANQWTVVQPANTQPPISHRSSEKRSREARSEADRPTPDYAAWQREFAANPLSATATIDEPGRADSESNGSSTMPAAERTAPAAGQTAGSGNRRFSATDDRRSAPTGFRAPDSPISNRRRKAPRLDRLALILALGVVSVGALGVLTTLAYGWLSDRLAPGAGLQGEQLQIQLDQPPIPIPDPAASPTSADPNAPLTEAAALEIVEKWLSTKRAALGETHAIDQLDQILAEPVLSQWRNQAEDAQRDNWYFEYEHSATIKSVTVPQDDPNQAEIEAEVREAANAFRDGEPDGATSRDEVLQVRYDLIRQDGEWRIEGIKATVLP